MEVKKIYLQLLKQQGKIVTTDYILDETFTLLFKRMPFELACESIEILKQAEKNDFLCIEWITPERFENALVLRRKFKDKPGISFTDITSMTVMSKRPPAKQVAFSKSKEYRRQSLQSKRI